MKNAPNIVTLSLALAFGTGAAFAGEGKENRIEFAALPPAVKKTIQAQADAKSATVGEVEKETEHGKVSYEAEITVKDGTKFKVEVTGEGSLIKVKADDDDEDGENHQNDDDDEDEDEDEDGDDE